MFWTFPDVKIPAGPGNFYPATVLVGLPPEASGALIPSANAIASPKSNSSKPLRNLGMPLVLDLHPPGPAIDSD